MFTLEELKAAHARVKTGADFPNYIQEIKKLGLATYEFIVSDGSTNYYSQGGYCIKGEAIYPALRIAKASSIQDVEHAISIHQQGQTDFMTFCKQVADAGVEKWIIDTNNMLCTYLDCSGTILIAEPIPEGAY
ncbi:DUF1398 domain-containing protein [Mucilaginibacter ginkgonis]|uniref:DUF1398 family protein n=1 Tax=Mucilaginibacter ginkgonis TaxID=2682091 RepID=A0A6I4HWB7_9SPHI|nr:DUF1398 family protein [Mucilaginibacter ginkgonis]QQL50120.1 DUF1398 family protein [Mucilaginibacter ginkgonis]